jgi:hypothetical protein
MASDQLSSIASIVVNGQQLLGGPGGQNEAISTNIAAPWGLTIITASATDDCGNTSEIAQAFIRSDAFYPAVTWPEPTATVTGGIAAHFNQPAIDDGERQTNDDIASILESVLPALFDYDAKLNQLFPEPLLENTTARTKSCNFPNSWVKDYYVVSANSLSLGSLSIRRLVAESGKLNLELGSDEISGLLNLDLRIYTCTLGVKTNVKVTPNGFLNLFGPKLSADILLDVDSGEVDVSASNPVLVDPGSLGLSGIECGIAQSICDYLFALIRNEVRKYVEDFFIGLSLDVSLPLEGLLNQFTPQADFLAQLPPPLDTKLTVAAEIDSVVATGPTGGGAIDMGLNSLIFPSERGASISPNAPGSPRRETAPAVFQNQGYDLGFGIKDDVLNQLFWSAWYGGGLENLDFSSQTGNLSLIDSLSLEFNLPPVLMPAGEPDAVQIALGDAALLATAELPVIGQVSVEGFASVLLGGALELEETRQALGFRIDSTTVFVEIVASDAPPGSLGIIQAQLEQAIAAATKQLVGSIVGGYPIPTIDLHELNSDVFAQGEIVGLFGANTDRPNEAVTRITGFTEADFDSDGDGAVDSGDNCIDTPNNDQSDVDKDSFGDACDNCIFVRNSDQRDTNDDGFGNICDVDLNNDCAVNFVDKVTMRGLLGGSDPDADLDGDGLVGLRDLQIALRFPPGPPGPSGLPTSCGAN